MRLLPRLESHHLQNPRFFRLHLISAVFGGISMGVVLNHEYIAVNGLHASTWQVTALTMLWPVSNLLAVFINHWLDSWGRYDRAVLVFGVLCRLPVALMFFSSNVNLMLGLLFLFFASNSVILPAQNSIMKQRYSDGHRARLYGWWTSMFTLFSLPVAMLAGVLLDLDFQYYRILFVVEAVFGAGQAVFLSRMARGMESSLKEKSTGKGSAHFFRSLWAVFRRDPDFAWFEVYFFIYGIAFLMVLPVIPFFATEKLHLDYQEYALAKGVIGQLGVLLFSPFLGVRLGKLHPFRFTGIVCLILALYPLSMAAADLLPEVGVFLFYTAYGFFALGMAGIRLSWNISSLHFAPQGQEATYQGLHVTMTALRASFAPILGSVLLHFGGFKQAFLVSFGFFTLSGILFLRRFRKRRREGAIP
ncbi:MAG: MFS transporter [Candidatus Aegiribacteria sp.]|nr:MFS transporter [Candidatus Aegiribacteria sp.]MBD3294380.1 MFS transporter [Candidatus Fermentibacteria bacterium]